MYVQILSGIFFQYRCAPHDDVSVKNGPHIRWWSHSIIILAIVVQLLTVFSTVQVCSLGAVDCNSGPRCVVVYTV